MALALAFSSRAATAGEISEPVNNAILVSIQGTLYTQEGEGGPIVETKLTTEDFLEFCPGNPAAQLVVDASDGLLKVVDLCGVVLCTLSGEVQSDNCVEQVVFKKNKATLTEVCVSFLAVLDEANIAAAFCELSTQLNEEEEVTKASYSCTINFIFDGAPAQIVVQGKKLFVPAPECAL